MRTEALYRAYLSDRTEARCPSAKYRVNDKRLYFHDAAGMLVAVDVQPQGRELHSGIPRQLFSAPGGVRPLDTAPDGRILAMVHSFATIRYIKLEVGTKKTGASIC
jgi:hypothetical protein